MHPQPPPHYPGYPARPLDPRWSRLAGLQSIATLVTIDRLLVAGSRARAGSCATGRRPRRPAAVTETSDQALEQAALDYIRAHGRTTTDRPGTWPPVHVYAYLFPRRPPARRGTGGHRHGRAEDAPRGRHPHGA